MTEVLKIIMDNEIKKTEENHNVSIALIQKDIQYIRESMAKIDMTLSVFDRNFARKEELQNFEKVMGDTFKEVKILIDTKVSNEDFAPMKTTLNRVNWLIISAVVVGLLSLIIRTIPQ